MFFLFEVHTKLFTCRREREGIERETVINGTIEAFSFFFSVYTRLDHFLRGQRLAAEIRGGLSALLSGWTGRIVNAVADVLFK